MKNHGVLKSASYYGFPPHYYEIKYPNVGNKALAESVIARINSAGLKAEGVTRGLDHGVFAPFTVAFNPEKNPLQVPIVQVSLFDSDDPNAHYKLGQAVQSLRDEGIQIIVSGMAVHNLRDMWRAMSMPGPMPYTTSFDQALKDAAEQPVRIVERTKTRRSLTDDSRKRDKQQWLSFSRERTRGKHTLHSSIFCQSTSVQVLQGKT